MTEKETWSSLLRKDRQANAKRRRGTVDELEPHLRGPSQNRYGGQKTTKVKAGPLYKSENESHDPGRRITGDERKVIEQRLLDDGKITAPTKDTGEGSRPGVSRKK